MSLVFLALGAVGHMVLWVALINRSHALGLHRRWVNLITVLCVAAIMFVPLGVAAAWLVQLGGQTFAARFVSAAAWSYILLCAGVCIGSTIQRFYWARHSERYAALVANHTTHVRLPVDSESLTAHGWPTWLSRLPGNQVLKIRRQEKELAIPRLQQSGDLFICRCHTGFGVYQKHDQISFMNGIFYLLDNREFHIIAGFRHITAGIHYHKLLPGPVGPAVFAITGYTRLIVNDCLTGSDDPVEQG